MKILGHFKSAIKTNYIRKLIYYPNKSNNYIKKFEVINNTSCLNYNFSILNKSSFVDTSLISNNKNNHSLVNEKEISKTSFKINLENNTFLSKSHLLKYLKKGFYSNENFSNFHSWKFKEKNINKLIAKGFCVLKESDKINQKKVEKIKQKFMDNSKQNSKLMLLEKNIINTIDKNISPDIKSELDSGMKIISEIEKDEKMPISKVDAYYYMKSIDSKFESFFHSESRLL